MFLDPAKLLVILIVALVVLGPDKLPSVARQMGAAWGEIRRFRERLETEVRGAFPDLPSTHQVAQAVRSPLAFLDQLADAHEREQKDATQNGTDKNGATQPDVIKPELEQEGSTKPLAIQPSVPVSPEPQSPTPVANGSARSAPRLVGRTRPWSGSQPTEPAFIPDDPSLN
jgi:sec-independent protein translocase protein TatB